MDVVEKILGKNKKKKYVEDPECCMTDEQIWEERHGHFYDDW